MKTPSERDLSYQAGQRAASMSCRGKWVHFLHPDTGASRRIRRAMARIVRLGTNGEQVQAVRRLLGCDPVQAAAFLKEWVRPPVKAKPKAVAFNHTPGELRENGKLLVTRPDLRNAAKAARRKPNPKGPAEQPRTPRSARYQRTHGVSP